MSEVENDVPSRVINILEDSVNIDTSSNPDRLVDDPLKMAELDEASIKEFGIPLNDLFEDYNELTVGGLVDYMEENKRPEEDSNL